MLKNDSNPNKMLYANVNEHANMYGLLLRTLDVVELLLRHLSQVTIVKYKVRIVRYKKRILILGVI